MNFIFSVYAWLEYFSEDVRLNKLHDEPIWWWSDVNDYWVMLHVNILWNRCVMKYDCGHDAKQDVWMTVREKACCVRYWAPEFLLLYVLFTVKHKFYCLNLDDWLIFMWMSNDQGHVWKPFSSQIFTQNALKIISFLNLSLKQDETLWFEITYLELGWE